MSNEEIEKDEINEIYVKIESNQKQYSELMAKGDVVKNAVKFNAKLNKRTKKLGLTTCNYSHREDDNGGQD